MALNPQDINNLNKFGAQLNQSVGQMTGTVSQMNTTLNGFATRLENILDPEGVFKKGGKKAGEGFKGGVTDAAKLFDKMIGGTASRFTKVIGGVGKGAGLALVGSLVATIFKQFQGLRVTSNLVTKQFGMMNKQAHDLTKQGRNMVTQLGAYRGQWDLVAKTAAQMGGEFISMARVSGDLAQFAATLEQGLGVASTDTAKIMGQMTQFMGFSDKAAKDMVSSFGTLAEGSALTFSELIKHAAEGSEVMAAMGAKNVLQYQKLALYTKQRGISMQRVQAFMEGEADYAGILKNTMKTNILLGTKMNAREILRAKLTGDYEGFMDATVGHMAMIAKWDDIDIFKKREMMKLTGLSMKELQRQFLIERKQRLGDKFQDQASLDQLEAEIALKAKKASYEEQAFNNMKKQATVMEDLKAIFIDKMLVPIRKFVDDRFGGFEEMLIKLEKKAANIGELFGGWIDKFLNQSMWKQAAMGAGAIIGPYLLGAMFSTAAIGAAMTAAFKGLGGGMKLLFSGGAKGTALKGVMQKAGVVGLIASLGFDLYGAFTKEGKKKKKATGRTIGGAIGAAVGFAFGAGPVGALVGYQIGAAAGGAIGESMATAADHAMENLQGEVDAINKKLTLQKQLKGALEDSIKLAFADKHLQIDVAGEDLLGGDFGGDIQKKLLEAMFGGESFEENVAKWNKLDVAGKMAALQTATGHLKTAFDEAVTSTKEWKDQEAIIRKANNSMAQAEIRLRRQEIAQRVVDSKTTEELNKELADHLRSMGFKGEIDLLAENFNKGAEGLLSMMRGTGKGQVAEILKLSGIARMDERSKKWVPTDKAKGMDIETEKELYPFMRGIIEASLKTSKLASDTDLLQFFESEDKGGLGFDIQTMLTMTQKQLGEAFDLMVAKSAGINITEAMDKLVAALKTQQGLVEEADIPSGIKDGIIRVQDTVVKTSGDDIVTAMDKGSLAKQIGDLIKNVFTKKEDRLGTLENIEKVFGGRGKMSQWKQRQLQGHDQLGLGMPQTQRYKSLMAYGEKGSTPEELTKFKEMAEIWDKRKAEASAKLKAAGGGTLTTKTEALIQNGVVMHKITAQTLKKIDKNQAEASAVTAQTLENVDKKQAEAIKEEKEQKKWGFPLLTAVKKALAPKKKDPAMEEIVKKGITTPLFTVEKHLKREAELQKMAGGIQEQNLKITKKKDLQKLKERGLLTPEDRELIKRIDQDPKIGIKPQGEPDAANIQRWRNIDAGKITKFKSADIVGENINKGIVPAGGGAEKTPIQVNNTDVVVAINNLAQKISDKPIVVQIDGKEVTRVLYKEAMNVG